MEVDRWSQLVLLCMLAFDPFIQHILGYPARSTEKPGVYASQLRYYSPALPDWENTVRLISQSSPASGNPGFPSNQRVHLEIARFLPFSLLRSAVNVPILLQISHLIVMNPISAVKGDPYQGPVM